MFGFFKKKGGEIPEEEQRQRSAARKSAAEIPQELRTLGQDFLPEELTVLAVTGAGGFGAGRMDSSDLWQVSIGLTAWMEEDSPEIHQGDFQLVSLADDTLRDYLRQRLRPDFILKFSARLSGDGRRLLLLNLPEPAFDPDLKAILEEQKKPESLYVDGLGTFVLNRQVKWFETEVAWLDSTVRLEYDQGPADEMKQAHSTARSLMTDQSEWDKRVREYAADQLLELANQWAADGEEGDNPQEVTRADFISRMELDAIQVDKDGGFEFWFNDGDLFWGHSIRVSGTLADGPDDAQMEG